MPHFSCGECRFSVPMKRKDLVACHRYPPQVSGDAVSATTNFPVVKITSWCGEFQPLSKPVN